MIALCEKAPTSDACRQAVNVATQYIAMLDAWSVMHDDVVRSSQNTFGYIFNSPDAKRYFTLYYNTIDNRADFFGAMNQYEQNLGSGTKWFGGADEVSREMPKGLGADGSGSRYSFFAGALLFTGIHAYEMYEWRSEAGITIMNTGFDGFRDLYNNGTSDAAAWDINQLRSEQQTLQPIHEKYLENRTFYTWIIAGLAVDILDYKARVQYGCNLLGYSANQGCKP